MTITHTPAVPQLTRSWLGQLLLSAGNLHGGRTGTLGVMRAMPVLSHMRHFPFPASPTGLPRARGVA